MALGEFTAAGNQLLDATGKKIRLTGTNWGGAEHDGMVPVGLWVRSYKSMLDQMKQLGFNCIRWPYCDDAVVSTTRTLSAINYGVNPDLQNLTPLEVWDKIITYANQIGLFIIFDHHRTWAGNASDSGTMDHGLWFDYDGSGPWTETMMINNWKALAARYKSYPNIVGADLHNELHNAMWTKGSNNGLTWGGGGARDWAAAAERIGNAILTIAPHWMIIVEGIDFVTGTWQSPLSDFWGWGSNLVAAKPGRRPITLDLPNKLMYSAHDYLFALPQHVSGAANFPQNLPAYWTEFWGWNYTGPLAAQGVPVLMGEFGGWMSNTKETSWMLQLQQYMAGDFNGDGTNDLPSGDLGVHWTHWNWGPLSGDTGGVLNSDWQTVNTPIYNSIKNFLYTGSITGGTGSGGTTTTSGGGGTNTGGLGGTATNTMTAATPIYSNNFSSSLSPFYAQSGTIAMVNAQLVVTPAAGYEGARYFQTLSGGKLVNLRFKMQGNYGVGFMVFDGQNYSKLVEDDDWTGVAQNVSVSFTTPSHGVVDIALVSGTAQRPAYFDDFVIEYAGDSTTTTPPPSTGGTTTTPPPSGGAQAPAPSGTSVGWRTSGNQIIDGAGNPVQFTGLNLTGIGTYPGTPHGIGQRSYQDQLSHIKQLGFNCIRLVFCDDTVLATHRINATQAGKSPDLIGKTPLEVLKAVADYCNQINLFVVLDNHRTVWDGTNGEWGMQRNGLWYETRSSFGRVTTPQDTINIWRKVAQTLKGNMVIWGADIHNESAGPATWGGTGNINTDWPAFCEACGNAILTECPDWLIVVEGVERGPQPWGDYVGPGSALQGAKARPVQLNIPNKVVYSSHPYGPELSPNFDPWRTSNGFPNNLPTWWNTCWGYLFWENRAPVLAGEFGAPLDDGNQASITYNDRLLKYMTGQRNADGVNSLTGNQRGISWTRWEWAPYSGDTKGILDTAASDFVTINQTRYNALKPYLFSGPVVKPVSGVVTGGGSTNPGGGTTTPPPTTTNPDKATWPPIPAQTKHLYVSKTGNDTSGTGTQALPFASIQKAASVATAGTIVHVGSGVYTGQVTQSANGTASAPIIFVSDTQFGAVIQAPSNSSGYVVRSTGDYVWWVGFDISGTGSTCRFGISVEGTKSRVSYCKIHDISRNTASPTNGGAGMLGEFFRGKLGQICEYNIIYNIGPDGQTSSTLHAIYFTGTGEIYGNLIYKCVGVGIHGWHSPRELKIYNNTVDGAKYGVYVGFEGMNATYNGWPGPTDNCEIRNNLIMNTTSAAFGEQGSVGTGMVYTDNHTYNVGSNFALVTSTPPQRTSSGDPKLVNTAGRDYHPQQGSPLIDKGFATGAPTLDLDLYPRIQGGKVDIGAYEYLVPVAGGGTTTPPPDTGSGGTTTPPPPPPPPDPVPQTGGYSGYRSKTARAVLSGVYTTVYSVPTGMTAMITMAHVTNVHAVSPVFVSTQWLDASNSNAATRLGSAVRVPFHGTSTVKTDHWILMQGDSVQAMASIPGGAEMTLSIIEFTTTT